MRAVIALVATLLLSLPLPAGQQAAPGRPPLSERVVAYRIDARLDPGGKTIDAGETLVYRNLTGQPLDRFPFHLYLNAFQVRSTWMREAYHGGSARSLLRDDPEGGAIEVRRLEVAGIGDLTTQMRFVQPDDGNADDRTVMEVALPKPVAPGESVEFRMQFHAKLPRVIARTGWADPDFFMVAQWFPKVGVWWNGAWNCHQFHAFTEFFADFGTYDVKATLPRNYVVGSSGEQLASVNNGDGTRTVTWHAEDVIDFAWTACPRFRVVESTWKPAAIEAGSDQAPEVRIRALISPGHMNSAQRYLDAARGSLDRFTRWYGSYPYRRLTIVDPPEGGWAAGGMEYPTLITGDTWRWMPRGLRLPELAIEHEFGHQYWYAMVATNEFEEAWLDEGVNTYCEAKVMDSLYRNSIDLLGMTMTSSEERRLSYVEQETPLDALARPSYTDASKGSYGATAYAKTATVLLTLEGLIGEETVREALHIYFMRYRFKHPTGQDFISTLEEASGRDLRWYFDQAVSGTQSLDYAVQSVRSQPADPQAARSQRKYKGVYRSEALIVRRGDFVFPVDVRARFADGSQANEQWDGRDRWHRFNWDRNARLASVEIDPRHRVWLDRDQFNNSSTMKASTAPAAKLANYCTFFAQMLAQFFALFV